MTTKQATPAELQAEAERLAGRAAAAAARVHEAQVAEASLAAQQQAEADRAQVSGFRRAVYEQDVDAARTAVAAAVREMPVVQALAALQAAETRRYMAVQDLLAARGRLGMPTDGAQLPPSGNVGPLGEYVAPVVQRIATELMDAHRNEREK